MSEESAVNTKHSPASGWRKHLSLYLLGGALVIPPTVAVLSAIGFAWADEVFHWKSSNRFAPAVFGMVGGSLCFVGLLLATLLGSIVQATKARSAGEKIRLTTTVPLIVSLVLLPFAGWLLNVFMSLSAK